MNKAVSKRTAIQIAYSTWRALFLREAVNRLLAKRAAWVWILLEPIVHVGFMLFVFIAIRMRSISGLDIVIWLTMGMLAFFMFRRTATQAMNALDANQALFTYRQVKPVDTVLVRAALEGFLMLLVSLLIMTGAGLFGHTVMPSDPLAVLEAMTGLWLLGVGFGLIASVADGLISELGKIIGFAMMPLYLLSGVIFPLSSLPQPYREILMLNPIAHGVEATRAGFSPYYLTMPELNIAYLFQCALVCIFAGLALHVKYAERLVMR